MRYEQSQRIGRHLLIIAGLAWLASLAIADVLVTNDGERIETQGAWKVKGRQLVYTNTRGVLSAMRLADVDLDASEQATRQAAEPATSQPAESTSGTAPRKATRSFTNDDIGTASESTNAGSSSPTEQNPGAENLRATFGTVANGYSVRATCNGRTLPDISGGQSQAVQLFHVDHPNRAKMEADLEIEGSGGDRKYLNLFCLQEGSNTLEIGYEPTAPSSLNLRFYLNAPNYTSPIFEFEQEERVAGTFSTNFELYQEMPEGHQTRILR